jgi:hypothetical protein
MIETAPMATVAGMTIAGSLLGLAIIVQTFGDPVGLRGQRKLTMLPSDNPSMNLLGNEPWKIGIATLVMISRSNRA